MNTITMEIKKEPIIANSKRKFNVKISTTGSNCDDFEHYLTLSIIELFRFHRDEIEVAMDRKDKANGLAFKNEIGLKIFDVIYE